ncbi:Cilia and flagella-associated protein 70 [Taenia crassiceps]|uniref:Cilia and flagella-associated protein 70 n=1 Tax=Taenia crassiceps TaxID=6207 RepID=A0ABR4Q2V1_9CEST
MIGSRLGRVPTSRFWRETSVSHSARASPEVSLRVLRWWSFASASATERCCSNTRLLKAPVRITLRRKIGRSFIQSHQNHHHILIHADASIPPSPLCISRLGNRTPSQRDCGATSCDLQISHLSPRLASLLVSSRLVSPHTTASHQSSSALRQAVHTNSHAQGKLRQQSRARQSKAKRSRNALLSPHRYAASSLASASLHSGSSILTDAPDYLAANGADFHLASVASLVRSCPFAIYRTLLREQIIYTLDICINATGLVLIPPILFINKVEIGKTKLDISMQVTKAIRPQVKVELSAPVFDDAHVKALWLFSFSASYVKGIIISEAKKRMESKLRTFLSALSVDIELSKPLLPQRKEESAVLEVRDVLKAMGPASTEPMNALKCARALGSGIIRLLSDVFSHVRPPFERLGVGNEASGSFNFAPNERALEDIYLDFQSHLHFPIAADVRKCFAEITESLLQDCIQNFLGDLKVRLMQEGRELLRCVVEGEYEARGMPSIGGLTQSDLRYFAEEAEVLGNLSWANFFVQNMLAEEPKSKETLIAASSFYARVGNREEAIVCLRWWLEMSPDDAEVLWRLGILLAEVGKLDEAKRLLEAASQIAPSDATLWTVLGDTRDFERTLAVMDQLKHPSNITSEASKSDGQEEEEEEEEESVVPQYTDCMDLIGTIDRLLEVKASTFVDRALARLLLHMKEYRCTLGGAEAEDEFKLPDWIVRSSRSCRDYMHDLSAYHRLLARHIMQSSEEAERLQQAEAHLKAASQRQPECADNWACLGSLRCLQGDKEGAIDCFERAMQLETWPVEKSHLLQVQLARCYAEVKDFERSKSQYLRCCNKHPTAESWKGVGVACLRLNELEEAEVAFKEANRLNNRDAAVWAYLAMLCLKAKKRTQAEICLQAVEMLGLADESIRKELDEVLTNTENLSNDGN